MRLGQLARKLALRPGEIVEFLAKNNIHIDEGTNTRLDDAYVKMIEDRYAPDLATVPAPVVHEEIIQPPVSSPEVESIAEDISEPDPNVEIPQQTVVDKTLVEVIKAPKVSLSGLKVLGKIELPEAKKKDPLPESTVEQQLIVVQEEKRLPVETRTRYNQKRNREQRPEKNPIALQREQAALEEQKQRQEKLEREREKRKQNYYKKVKMSPPTKAVKLVDEPTMQMSAEELAEPPKTWLGRLIKWLTT